MQYDNLILHFSISLSLSLSVSISFQIWLCILDHDILSLSLPNFPKMHAMRAASKGEFQNFSKFSWLYTHRKLGVT